MKKIIVSCICIMLVMTITPLVVSGEIENGFEKDDNKRDVVNSLIFQRKNGMVLLTLFQRLSPLIQIFLKHLDIVSFSIFEDVSEPEFLYAKMEIRDFKYSEPLSFYVICWTYNDIDYFVETGTATRGGYISSIVGYTDEDNIEHIFPINGEINEEDSILIWTIPKDLIGNPKAGDQLLDIFASSTLISQKDIGVLIKLYLAFDSVFPPYNESFTYVIQY